MRLHQPGAGVRLRDAIAAMQKAGVGASQVDVFQKALAVDGGKR